MLDAACGNATPSGAPTTTVSVDSSIGGVGIGVLDDEAVLEEFRFSLLRL